MTTSLGGSSGSGAAGGERDHAGSVVTLGLMDAVTPVGRFEAARVIRALESYVGHAMVADVEGPPDRCSGHSAPM